MDSELSAFQAEALRCTRCGSCQSICPIHQNQLTEDSCARGKVFLTRSLVDERVKFNEDVFSLISNCLLCKACVANCPSGIKTDLLFLQARKALAKQVGLPWMKKFVFTSMTYRKLFDFGLQFGSMFQNIFLKDSPDGAGKLSRLPLPAAGLNKRRILPSLSRRPLRTRLPNRNTVAKAQARVAFFPGCMLNYVYPETGEAIVKVLKQNNIDVDLLDGLSCCGVPAISSGDFAVGQQLAANNVSILTQHNYDAIITGCASCGSALQHDYGLVLADEALAKWEAMSTKVFDITQYLTNIGYNTDFSAQKCKVTYHDPCHLVRGMQVSKEPRNIIKSIPGVDFVEMKDANRCCGCGGTFSLTHYDTSRIINDQKVNNIEQTGAEILLTGCSACKMHITDGLSRNNSSVKVMHTAEFLANAYK